LQDRNDLGLTELTGQWFGGQQTGNSFRAKSHFRNDLVTKPLLIRTERVTRRQIFNGLW